MFTTCFNGGRFLNIQPIFLWFFTTTLNNHHSVTGAEACNNIITSSSIMLVTKPKVSTPEDAHDRDLQETCWKVKKKEVYTNGSSSLLQRTLLLKCLKCLFSSLAFNLVDILMSPCHTFASFLFIFTAEAELTGSQQTWQSWPETLWETPLLAQACVSWPIRADWVFGRRGLQETGAKTDRGGTQSCSTGQCEKTDALFEHWACESILVLSQNKTMNLKMSIICLLYSSVITIASFSHGATAERQLKDVSLS